MTTYYAIQNNHGKYLDCHVQSIELTEELPWTDDIEVCFTEDSEAAARRYLDSYICSRLGTLTAKVVPVKFDDELDVPPVPLRKEMPIMTDIKPPKATRGFVILVNSSAAESEPDTFLHKESNLFQSRLMTTNSLAEAFKVATKEGAELVLESHQKANPSETKDAVVIRCPMLMSQQYSEKVVDTSFYVIQNPDSKFVFLSNLGAGVTWVDSVEDATTWTNDIDTRNRLVHLLKASLQSFKDCQVVEVILKEGKYSYKEVSKLPQKRFGICDPHTDTFLAMSRDSKVHVWQFPSSPCVNTWTSFEEAEQKLGQLLEIDPENFSHAQVREIPDHKAERNKPMNTELSQENPSPSESGIFYYAIQDVEGLYMFRQETAKKSLWTRLDRNVTKWVSRESCEKYLRHFQKNCPGDYSESCAVVRYYPPKVTTDQSLAIRSTPPHKGLLQKWEEELAKLKNQLFELGSEAHTHQYSILSMEALRLSMCISDLQKTLLEQ